MIKPGETLFDAKRKVSALVRAEGALQLGDRSARSIASARSRRALGPATAGPTGTSKRNKKLTSIDEFRAEMRATMSIAARITPLPPRQR